MLTEDLFLPSDGSWLGIPPLDTDTIVYNGSDKECLIRFGASSHSYGMILMPEQVIIVDEIVYVRIRRPSGGQSGTIRVTR